MKLTSKSQKMMGCTVTLSIFHPDAESILNSLFAFLWIFEQRFSANSSHSELASINRQAGKTPVQVESDLFDLIAIGKEHSLAKNSQLNIAIGPLVQAWRIGFADARVPQPEEIARALHLIDPQLIRLDEQDQSVFLEKKGMKIDLGALAKGYAADLLAKELHKQGVDNALINLGGNVLTLGYNLSTGQPWRVGIQNPLEKRGRHLAIVPATNQSVVTSGVYERTLTINGQSYHHIFDRKTGYPIKSDLASLTILSPKSLDGEIWTTRLFGKSIPEILVQIEGQEHLEALAIDTSNQLYSTSGFPFL